MQTSSSGKIMIPGRKANDVNNLITDFPEGVL